MKKHKQGQHFISKRNFIGYVAGGGAYFWSAWLIITFGEKYLGLWWINIIGNLVGITLNYFCQRYLAFPGKNILNSGERFALITVLNLLLSYFILRWLTGLNIELWFAQFISAGIFTIWNYTWYKLWVFRR
ncbi:MAG: GtrA family protein [Patescibacteria group bacterium]